MKKGRGERNKIKVGKSKISLRIHTPNKTEDGIFFLPLGMLRVLSWAHSIRMEKDIYMIPKTSSRAKMEGKSTS